VAIGKNIKTLKIFLVIGFLAALFGYGLYKDVVSGHYKEYSKHKTVSMVNNSY
jgi:hypothetical protein